MGAWRQQYDHFAGPRYANLIGYAQLLTGDRQRADALVAFALRRTFGRLRRRASVAQTEAEIRRRIVERFLATAGPVEATSAQAPTGAASQPKAPVTQPTPSEVDLSIYAPPTSSAAGETPSQTLEFLHAPVTHVTDEALGDSHVAHEPHQSQPRAEVEKSAGDALAVLEPRARAMTIMRHLDGFTPTLIATQLRMETDEVIDELHAAYAVLRSQLGISIPNEPNRTVSAMSGAHQVDVTAHRKGR